MPRANVAAIFGIVAKLSAVPGLPQCNIWRRYYNPALGRFLGRDPKQEKGGLHLYGFVGNNGVNRWDYLGMSGSGSSWTDSYLESLGIDPNGGQASAAVLMNNQEQEMHYTSMFGKYNSGGGGSGANSISGTNEYGGDNSFETSVDASNSIDSSTNGTPLENMPTNAHWQSNLRTYNSTDGTTYVVTSDITATAPSGSTSYDVTAGGGAPLGFVGSRPMVNLGEVGSDPINGPASSRPSSSLPDIPVNYSSATTNYNSYYKPYVAAMQSYAPSLRTYANLGDATAVLATGGWGLALAAPGAVELSGEALTLAKASGTSALIRTSVILSGGGTAVVTATNQILSGTEMEEVETWLNENPWIDPILDGDVPPEQTMPPPDIPMPTAPN